MSVVSLPVSSQRGTLLKSIGLTGMPSWTLVVGCTLLIGLVFLTDKHRWDRSGLKDYVESAEERAVAAVSGNSQRRLAFLALGVSGAAMLALSGRVPGLREPLGVCILLAAAWTFGSVFWAHAFSFTVKRLLLLILCVSGVLGMASTLTLRQLSMVVCAVAGSYLLLGIVAEVLQGNFRPFNSGYRFAGTLHPNAQSTNCGALALSTYALWQDAGRPESYRRRRISGGRLAFGMLFCFAVFFLVMTKSRTALAAVLLTTALLRATTQRAWSNLLIAATGLLACLTLAYVAAVFGAAGAVGDAASMGRDDSKGTFNGRLPIWEICWSEVGQRWPIGFGYDGFWTADRIESVSWKLGWSISSAHCEYIEIALGLGVIGVGLYLLVQVAGISRFWLRYFRLGHGGDAMILGLLMVGVMQGLMETGDLHPSSMTPFIVLTGMVRLAFFTPRKVALEGAV